MKHSGSLLAITTLLVIICGCATTGAQPTGNDTFDRALVYGEPMFGNAVYALKDQTIAPEAVLALTPEMQAFTRKLIRKGLPPMDRARRLVNLLVRKDFFPKGYYTDDTRTASDVFEKRSGNCLSYTNLFVAMARELDLSAHFQLARIPAAWSTEQGFLVRSRHINVLISDTRVPSKDWLTVDFNKVATSSLYPHTPVSDNFALSSFYNNLAIDRLYEKDYPATVAWLARAIEVEPNNGDAWVNLAAVYLRHDKPNQAQAAFQAALNAEPGHESALAGMARLYESRGEASAAQRYTEEIDSRRDRNPYFHFALAQAAYEQDALEQSLDAINRAIELRQRVGAFYYLKGLIHYARGELSQATDNLEQAQDRKRSLPAKKQEHALALAMRINTERAAQQGL